MDDLLRELKRLNNNLQRLADHYAPEIDRTVFDVFRAFRTFSRHNTLLIKGIPEPDSVTFRDLRGIDEVIQGIQGNTEQFLRGLPCNNVLLYGSRGTGKSSAIKALLNKYGNRGLMLIEMPKETMFHLFEVAELIRNRPEKFIIFCDDLSFRADDTSYRQLKTVLEGGIETKPRNMLIYATSNRRHLMPEQAADNFPVFSDGELHPAETVDEKLSLSDRFGLRFGIPFFDMDTYLDIVAHYADIRSIRIVKKSLKEKAVQWSLSHGSFSGRTALQFIDSLEGQLKQKSVRHRS